MYRAEKRRRSKEIKCTEKEKKGEATSSDEWRRKREERTNNAKR